MTGGSAGADVLNQVNTLFQVGAVGEVSDGQLLRRFLASRDEDARAAFGALVGRHGPMVLRVCLRVLGDPHDAQDAFQATFLVLARKAGSVRKADSVASWLHGVALRVAARSRAAAARRKACERRGAAEESAAPGHDGGRPEAWPELHEEVGRLPEKYRGPVVLCYLEGLSTEEAARRLGCPRGTVLSRLSRARDRLRIGLTRRGLAHFPAAAWLAAEPPPAIPGCLAAATASLAFGRLVAGDPLTAGAVPASVSTLTLEVLHAMTLAKTRTATVAVIAAALSGMAGAGVYAFQSRTDAVKPDPTLAQVAPASVEQPPRPGPAATDLPTPRVTPPAADRAVPDPATSVDPVAVQELAVQLDLARKNAARVTDLYSRANISRAEYDVVVGQVRLLEGRAVGRAQQLEDELELLKIRLEAKRSELEGAIAQVDYAKAGLAVLQKSNKRAAGSVSAEEMTKAEAAVRREDAARAVRAAEVRETQLRIRQAERRLLAIAPLLKAPDRDPTPARPPQAPAPPPPPAP